MNTRVAAPNRPSAGSGEPRNVWSGIRIETGDYARPPLIPHTARRRTRRGVRPGVDARALDQAGWAVVFGPDVGADARAALRPLLRRRREQAGSLYREIEFTPHDEHARAFLDRHGAPIGEVDPRRFPYYVLLVGTPRRMTFAFQQGLAFPHAVGRLAFDSPEKYAAYARNVLAAEDEHPRPRPRAALFAPRHAGDHATAVAHEHLVQRLATGLPARRSAWTVAVHDGARASKSRLGALLGGSHTADLLVTIGHGVVCGRDNPVQARLQGALVTAE